MNARGLTTTEKRVAGEYTKAMRFANAIRPPHRRNSRRDGSSLRYPGFSRYLFAKYACAIGIPSVHRIPVGNMMGSNKPVPPIIVEIDVPRPRKNTGLTPSLTEAFHPRVHVHSSVIVVSGVSDVLRPDGEEEEDEEGEGGVDRSVLMNL